jgi:hypothetical protein
MKLSSISRGKIAAPMRILIFGQEGVGKSTFGANAPSPVFLGAEDGTGHLDVHRFPTPATWQDVLDSIRTLTTETHDFKTLVLDSADWIEPLVWQHLCTKNNKPSIEDIGGGFGKGYVAAADEWRILLAALEGLRKARGMHVVTIAHSTIKPFKNPDGPDFERYELKLDKRASGILKEWHDAVLFASHETLTNKDERTKRVKGVSTGARVLHTVRTAAYDAKNRYSLPERLPLSWQDFARAIEAQRPGDPAALTAEIKRKGTEIGGQVERGHPRGPGARERRCSEAGAVKRLCKREVGGLRNGIP